MTKNYKVMLIKLLVSCSLLNAMEKQPAKSHGYFVKQVVTVFDYMNIKSTAFCSTELLNQARKMLGTSSNELIRNQCSIVENKIEISYKIKTYFDLCDDDYKNKLIEQWNKEKRVAYVKWMESKLKTFENNYELIPLIPSTIRLIEETTNKFIEEQKGIKGNNVTLDDSLLKSCIKGVTSCAFNSAHELNCVHKLYSAHMLSHLCTIGCFLIDTGIIKVKPENLASIENIIVPEAPKFLLEKCHELRDTINDKLK